MMMCKEATRLMSLKQDRPLTLKERVSLRVHLMMCDACRHCNDQFTLLHRVGDKVEKEIEEKDLDDGTTTHRSD
jgi:predicted anti-sigma-YlaC factor YlaD